MYTLQIVKERSTGYLSAHFGKDYFPRQVKYLTEAKDRAKEACLHGADIVKIVSDKGNDYLASGVGSYFSIKRIK